MNLLLLGKNGQLGFELQRTLSLLGTVVAFDHQGCDLSDINTVRNCIRKAQPYVIVNAAAYTTVDSAETELEKAFAVNATAVSVIAEEALKLGALVVHYSTDYIFDGKKDSPYIEDDQPHPLNVYGASKLAGEKALRESGVPHLIFRTSWVTGVHGQNFLKTISRLSIQKKQLNVVADQYGAPTSSALIADVSTYIIRQAHRTLTTHFPYGTYHLTASGVTSWYAYACHIVKKISLSRKTIKLMPEAIKPVATSDYPVPAQRPLNSQLDTKKLRTTFDLELPDWRFGVDHILQQLLQNIV
jgi:dTDP-4-dehydrorhamnose reductase